MLKKSKMPHNKPILSDKNMSSCLLQKAQKPRQHIFAPDQGRYAGKYDVVLEDNNFRTANGSDDDKNR